MDYRGQTYGKKSKIRNVESNLGVFGLQAIPEILTELFRQLLTSCRRFYDRQFDARQFRTSDLMLRLDSIIDGYLSGEDKMPQRYAPPCAAWCATLFHLSPNYFGDLVRKEVNMTAKAYLQQKITDKENEFKTKPLRPSFGKWAKRQVCLFFQCERVLRPIDKHSQRHKSRTIESEGLACGIIAGIFRRRVYI